MVRDEFSVSLKCPGCNQAGVIFWSENNFAEFRYHGVNAKIEKLSSGFHLGEGLTRSGGPKVICDHCGAEIIDM